jgi:hypothetical protein
MGRIQRQKVRISRQRVLEAAVKVMDLYAKNKAILEVEYFDEVGTGLGPTLEFYTLVSQELQRKVNYPPNFSQKYFSQQIQLFFSPHPGNIFFFEQIHLKIL